MKYDINPPYTFYTKLVREGKLKRKNMIAEAPLLTHSQDTLVKFFKNGGKESNVETYEIYIVSVEIEKVGLFKTAKRYVHIHEKFDSLFKAALEYYNRTNQQLPESLIQDVIAFHGGEIDALPEREKAAFALEDVVA